MCNVPTLHRQAAALLLALAVTAGSAFAGNPATVTRLADAMDAASTGAVAGWRYSTDFSANPMKPGYPASAWKPLAFEQQLRMDSCWMQATYTVPASLLGQNVTGPLRFKLSVDDYGYLWINGEAQGRFPWDGDFLLTPDAKPGTSFTLTVLAVNTGGPMRLIRAGVVSGSPAALARTVSDLALSLRVGQKLLSFDTYQTNARLKVDPGIDRSHRNRQEKERLTALLEQAAADVDPAIFTSGTEAAIRTQIATLRDRIRPIGEYARGFTLFFDANAHIDAAWLWREKETVEVCKRTFSSVLNMMNARPDFTYTQSSALYFDWMERTDPALFAKIGERVREGRWEIVGGMWVEPDCNIPSGESWARQLLYAKRYFRSKFGADPRIGWNPDSFGYNLNMPMFYANAGLTAFITQKIGWNDTNVFPHRVFWWESPDGSRILSYFPFDYVNTVDNPMQLVDWLRQFEANTGFDRMLILFGVGDHGGGPSLEMIDRIERFRTLDIFPTIQYGTAKTYLGWMTSQDLSGIPVWRDELYLEYHQGTLTTQAAMKEANRKGEMLLTNAEKLSSFAALSGRSYHATDLEEAWRKLLFTQFHDILPGSGIREVYMDATRTHHDLQEIALHESDGALAHIAGQVNTASVKTGTPVVVMNTLGWPRTDIVRVELPEGSTGAFRIVGPDGAEVPSQVFTTGRYTREIVFIAQDIPACGYRTFALRSDSNPESSATPPTGTTIENTLFKVTVDPATGWLASIFDKKRGRELLTGPGNEIQLLEDVPSAWDAWNIGWTGVRYPLSFRSARIVEQGPVRTVIRMTHDYLKPGTRKEFPTEDFPSSFFTQDVILYNGLDRIDFRTDIDWWEEHTMAKVAFPLAFHDSVATYEIPYGTIQRSTGMTSSIEKARVEVPASRWADVSAGGLGVSLLNTAKYGYDIKGNIMRLSLLRSPKWPDPVADRGKHSITYSLYPHSGSWKEASTVERGYAVNTPLLAKTTGRHAGSLPPQYSFVGLTPANLVLTSVKKSEDGSDWIVQWYESTGKATEAVLTLPRKPAGVRMSNFMEEPGAAVPAAGSTVRVQTGAHGVVTLRVTY